MAQVNNIRENIGELADLFHSRMAEMQRDLDRAGAGTSSTSTSTVAAEFNTFKCFILKSLDVLQKQVELVVKQVDDMEMRSRRKMLVLHGLAGSTSSSENEDTTSLVIQKLSSVKASLSAADISRCHRLGKLRGNNPRPILVKFRNVSIRDEIWFGKVGLKGSGVTLGEFLTKPRHELFVAARERFGVRSCWSWNGDVFVLDADRVRHRVTSVAHLSDISVPPAASAASTPTTEVPPQSEEPPQPEKPASKRPKRVQKGGQP